MSDNQQDNHNDEQGLKTTPSGAWVLSDPHSSIHNDQSSLPSETTSDSEKPQLKIEQIKRKEDKNSHSSPQISDEEVQQAILSQLDRTPQEWQTSLKLKIKSNLEGLASVADDIGLHSIHDEILYERIPTLLEGKFTVVLLGEFNHGKSTVVNALMGENVLPTGITPTTSVITHLTEGNDDEIFVKMKRREEKERIQKEKLDGLIRQTDDDSIEYVEIHRSNPFLNDGLTLVDTPGVNDISKQKVEITYGYLPRADVIIYVLDATQILKKSEIRFLKDRLMKSKHDHLIFVLGKIDSLTPAEAKEVEDYAREKLSSLLEHAQLHAFSAREALEAQIHGEKPSPQFDEFRRDVLKLVDENRTFIVFESGVNAARRYVTQINQNLAIRRSALTMQVSEINDRISAVKARYIHAQKAISDTTDFIDTKIQEIIATSINNLHEFADSFGRSLPREIETSTPSDIQTHLPHFIQNKFKEWVEEEGRVLTNRLESLAIEVIEVTNQTIADTLRDLRADLGLSGDVDLEVDTLVYDVSIFALGATGFAVLFVNTLVGGILTLATPILAYYFRSKIGDKVKAKAKEEGVKAINSAANAVEKQMRESIEAYGERLKAFVESAGDHLFKQISETLETVKQDLQNNSDVNELALKTHHELDTVSDISKKLNEIQKSIDTQREAV